MKPKLDTTAVHITKRLHQLLKKEAEKRDKLLGRFTEYIIKLGLESEKNLSQSIHAANGLNK